MPHFGSTKFERYLHFDIGEIDLRNRDFCCDRMKLAATYECEKCKDKWECGDQILHYNPIFDEYGLIIHDGGTSYISISFCPWCGSNLPESKRDQWFEELEAEGYTDPLEQNIPEKYKSDAWYK